MPPDNSFFGDLLRVFSVEVLAQIKDIVTLLYSGKLI